MMLDHWHAPKMPKIHFRRGLLLAAPLLSLIAAIWACGAPPPVVTHQPPSKLRLAISFQRQYYGILGQVYGPTGDTSTVSIEVIVWQGQGKDAQTVLLPAHSTLTCNGVSLTLKFLSGDCPRQSAGGSYLITYTDEHGVSATTSVPVPAGSFGLRYPHVETGAPVKIPQDNTLAIPFTAPIPPAGGGVGITNVVAGCGAPNNDPLTPHTCGDVAFDAPYNTSKAVNPGDGIFLLKGNFAAFQPGPGHIELHMSIYVAPGRSGFAAVTANYNASIYIPILWSR